MARRSARFHLTLGDITRSTDASPETFLRYKHALMAHMSEFMAELDRYLPPLAQAIEQVEATGLGTLLNRAAEADDRPLMRRDEVLDDWRRRWAGIRAWFVAEAGGHSRTAELAMATRAGVSSMIALLRQITESQRGGVNRSTQLKHLAQWVFDVADEDAAHALMSAAFNLRLARHAGGAHDDSDLISSRLSWMDAPGVEVAMTLFRRGKAPSPGLPQRLGAQAGIRTELRRRQAEQRAAERDAARALLSAGVNNRVLDEAETRVLLKLLTRALEARSVVAGRIIGGTGGNDVMTVRLVPSATGSAVRTANGVLHLPGLTLEIASAGHRPGDGRRWQVAEPRAADGVAPSDLGSYQYAVRLVLTNDLITTSRPRAGALASVLRWADLIARDFAELLGYTLIATAHQVRLLRRLDTFDATQRSVFTARSGRQFDRRRLSYLCLVLAVFQRSRIEISLADLIRAFAPTANAIDGLGFDATITEHKRAVVDVLDWLTDRDALRLSDGSAENWAHDSEGGDALYDIDHDVCTSLFRPARPIQQLGGAAGLLDVPDISSRRSAQREATARRARRLLIEHPVLYYATLDAETAAALRGTDLADNLARLTGLVVERRAEGVMLVDPTGRFTDQPFPGRGGAVNRTAGLLLAKIADVLEDPDDRPALTRISVPCAADDLRDLLERIDTGLPGGPADYNATAAADVTAALAGPGWRGRPARGTFHRPDPAGAHARRTV